MRFILVNGRAPRQQSFCLACYQPIVAGYLREVGTGLTYCDQDCFADHCKGAIQLLENQSRASCIPGRWISKQEPSTSFAERSTHPAVGDESARPGERTIR
jgi:hypothetical protein